MNKRNSETLWQTANKRLKDEFKTVANDETDVKYDKNIVMHILSIHVLFV